MSTPLRQSHFTGSAFLMLLLTTAQLVACDICVRMPGTPFVFGHPAALELAQATCDAAESGRIDLNPVVVLPGSAALSRREVRLDNLSAKQLIHAWTESGAGHFPAELRFTMDVHFVDTEEVCKLDLRQGQIIARDSASGPADVRIVTSKPGWHRLLQAGIQCCESDRLLVIDTDAEGAVHRSHLEQLFPGQTVVSVPSEPQLRSVRFQ